MRTVIDNAAATDEHDGPKSDVSAVRSSAAELQSGVYGKLDKRVDIVIHWISYLISIDAIKHANSGLIAARWIATTAVCAVARNWPSTTATTTVSTIVASTAIARSAATTVVARFVVAGAITQSNGRHAERTVQASEHNKVELADSALRWTRLGLGLNRRRHATVGCASPRHVLRYGRRCRSPTVVHIRIAATDTVTGLASITNCASLGCCATATG